MMNLLVPIQLVGRQQRELDGTCKRTQVDLLAWCQLNGVSGKSLAPVESCRVADESRVALEEATQRLEQSLKQPDWVLVSVGPLALRQHLHPAAHQIQAQLSSRFDSYVDLADEFERRYGHWRAKRPARAHRCKPAGASPAAAATTTGEADPAWTQADWPAASSSEAHEPQQPADNDDDDDEQPAADWSQDFDDHEDQEGAQSTVLDEMLKFLAIDAQGQSRRSSCAKCHRKQSSSADSTSPPDAKCNEQQVADHCLECKLAGQLEAMSLLIERMISEGHQFGKQVQQIKRRVQVGLCELQPNHEDEKQDRVVRARGLPWQSTEQEIADFFTGLNISKGGVALCLSRQGRRNGEALIQFEDAQSRRLALARHKHFMGARYIEVYQASNEDFLGVASGYNNKAQAFLSRGAQAIVRMRGLPFTCTAQQVVDFFGQQGPREQRCQVLGEHEGVLFVKNQDEKPTGDAFVLFATDEAAQCALAKHRQNIGARYVELFRSSISEVQQVLSMNCANQAGQQAAEPGARRKQSPDAQVAGSAAAAAAAAKQAGQQANSWSAKAKAKEATYAQVATSYLQTPSKQADHSHQSATSSCSSSSGAFDANSLNSASSLMTAADLKPTPAGSVANPQEQPGDAQLLSAGTSISQSPISSPGSTCYKSSSSLSSGGGCPNHPQQTDGLYAPPNHLEAYQSPYSHHNHHNHYQHSQQPGLASPEPGAMHHAHFYQQQQQQFAAPTGYPAGNLAPTYGSPAMFANQPHQPTGGYLAAHSGQRQSGTFQQHQAQMAYAAAQIAYSFQFYPASQHHQHQHAAAYPPASLAAHTNQSSQSPPTVPGSHASRRDCIRLRGLPFEAQIEDVLYFLADQSKNIVYQGVHMVYSAQGQPTGEAIIQMNSCAAAQQAAQEFHKKVMSVGKKQRYIEVIPSSIEDMNLMLGGQFRSVAAMSAPHHAYYAPPPAQPLTAGVHLTDEHQSAPEAEVPVDQQLDKQSPAPKAEETDSSAGQPNNKCAPASQPAAGQANMMPTYYPVLYYYHPQQMLAAPAYH